MDMEQLVEQKLVGETGELYTTCFSVQIAHELTCGLSRAAAIDSW
jgi:hypothetical protein